MRRPPHHRPTLKTVNLMIRTTPRLKFAVELIARRQCKTYAQVVETAIEHLISDPRAQLEMSPREGEPPVNVLNVVWDADDAQRFVNLAEQFPRLLSAEERLMWEEINSHPKRYFHEKIGSDGYPFSAYVMADKVRANWAALNDLAKQLQERVDAAGA